MTTNNEFLEAIQSAELTWMRARCGHGMYEATHDCEPLKLRLNDFPDEVLLTLFFRDHEIDIEECPKGWHLKRE